jgi:antitoxin (DNA-binding transcriptional repressor) of toxin-antitoxin stability system
MTKTIALETLTMTPQKLLDTLSAGDEVVFTRNQQSVARLVVLPKFDASSGLVKEYSGEKKED